MGTEAALRLSSAALHSADLAHPTLVWELHKKLSLLCAEEFYAQYTEEQKLGLPSLPFMGKDPSFLPGLAPAQIGFIRFVTVPLWSAFDRALAAGESLAHVLETMKDNQSTWTEISDAYQSECKSERSPSKVTGS